MTLLKEDGFLMLVTDLQTIFVLLAVSLLKNIINTPQVAQDLALKIIL